MQPAFLFLFLFLSVLTAAANPYQLFEENGRVGLKDAQGQVILPAAFEALGWSDQSFSVAGSITGYQLNQRWGLIHLSQGKITPPLYHQLSYPGGNRVVATQTLPSGQEKTGCLDLKGEVKIPFLYDALEIHGLRAILIRVERGKYRFGMCNLDHEILIPVRYDRIYPIGPLRFAVEWEGKVSVAADDGRLFPFQLDSLSPFRGNQAVYFLRNRAGLIQRDGTFVTEARYADIQQVDGQWRGRMPTVWSRIHENGSILASCEGDTLVRHTRMSAVRVGPVWGLLDGQLQPLLPVRFRGLIAVSNTLVAVKEKKWKLLRLPGTDVLPAPFDTLSVTGDLVRARQRHYGRDWWYLFDTLGVALTAKPYDFMAPPDGYYLRVRQNGFWGLIDRRGREWLPCVYDSILDFREDALLVKFKSLYGIVSREDKWRVAPQQNVLKLLPMGCYLKRDGAQQYVMSLAGDIIYFSEFPLSFYSDHFMEHRPGGVLQKISYQGSRYLETSIPAPSAGELQLFEKDGKYGFKDSRGRVRIANRYDRARPFRHERAAVQILNRWGFIDADEHLVVQPAYDWAEDFTLTGAVVARNGKFGVINAAGQRTLELRYDTIERTAHDYLRLRAHGKWGLATATGKLLLEPAYDTLDVLSPQRLRVKRNGTWGILTPEGDVVIPLIYTHLLPTEQPDEYLVEMRMPFRDLRVPD